VFVFYDFLFDRLPILVNHHNPGNEVELMMRHNQPNADRFFTRFLVLSSICIL